MISSQEKAGMKIFARSSSSNWFWPKIIGDSKNAPEEKFAPSSLVSFSRMYLSMVNALDCAKAIPAHISSQ